MKEHDTFYELVEIVTSLDRRFPDGNEIFQRVSRLAEETGELAAAVNHAEGMGVKRQKHGEPDVENMLKEIQDVMRAAIGIAKHYGLEKALEESIHRSYQKNIDY